MITTPRTQRTLLLKNQKTMVEVLKHNLQEAVIFEELKADLT